MGLFPSPQRAASFKTVSHRAAPGKSLPGSGPAPRPWRATRSRAVRPARPTRPAWSPAPGCPRSAACKMPGNSKRAGNVLVEVTSSRLIWSFSSPSSPKKLIRPRCKIATRSATRSRSEVMCVEKITLRRPPAAMSSTTFKNSRRAAGSRLATGSSSTSSSGSCPRASTRASFCSSPTESVPARRVGGKSHSRDQPLDQRRIPARVERAGVGEDVPHLHPGINLRALRHVAQRAAWRWRSGSRRARPGSSPCRAAAGPGPARGAAGWSCPLRSCPAGRRPSRPESSGRAGRAPAARRRFSRRPHFQDVFRRFICHPAP